MATPYDEVAYPGYPHPQTHPDRLATIGSLLGLETAHPERCRVLEIGCGDGGNLLPMAYTLPRSEFTGIDTTAGAIGRAEALARELGLANIRFRAADLAEEGGKTGEFDYVIAHGVYSWVSAEVRDRLLAVCHGALAPYGVAYISYNVMPGGRLKEMLRDMLLFHVRDMESPAERIEQAREFAAFLLAGNVPAAIAEDLAALRRAPDWLIFHDHLAEVNQPVYFHEFAQHAADHGLAFLAEADFFEMSYAQFPAETRATLEEMESAETLLKEQYLDFLKCRRFRQTLLCRDEITVDRRIAPERVEPLWIASRAQETSGTMPQLAALAARWPESIPVRESSIDPCAIARLYTAGAVELRTAAPKFTTAVSVMPRVSAVARAQARHGTVVANLRHEAVDLENPEAARLVASLDGTQPGGIHPPEVLERLARLALLES